MELEHPFLRAPYEALVKFVRNAQQIAQKDTSDVVADAKKLTAKKAGKSEKESALKSLAALRGKLQALKRKLEDCEKQSSKYLQRCNARIDHLKLMDRSRADPTARLSVSKIRLERMMVDRMLREGCYQAASSLAADADIKELVDQEVFQSSKNVVDALMARDCSKALVWCTSNRSKLRRINSSLEFNLHLQMFIELVRQGKVRDAILYAQKNLSPSAAEHMPEISQAMTTLAFVKLDGHARYGHLFSESRWGSLIAQFRSDQLRLNGLTQNSLLSIALQAGLSALKTPFCGLMGHENPNCPLCSTRIAALARRLPMSHRSHSCLVCRITGEVMDERNPPLVLPNGNVYSKNALIAMSREHGGQVICPRSQQRFPLSECKNVYIL